MKKIPFVLLGITLLIGCPKKHRPNRPVIIGPEIDTLYMKASYSFSVSTTDPDGDSVAYYFDWGDKNSEWTDFLPSGDTASLSHSYSDTGEYTIIVVAMENTVDSLLSDTASYSIKICRPPGKPPKEPTVWSLYGQGYIDIPYTFYAMSKDPDNDSVAYRFYWGDGDTSNWGNYVPSGGTDSMAHAYHLSEGIDSAFFSVRAQAKDIYGLESGWSTGKGITIRRGNHPPYPPNTILGPTKGVVNESYSFSTYTTDPDSGDKISYMIDWGDGSTSGWSREITSGDTITFSHSYSLKGDFSITAKAKDNHGAESGWSPSHPITVIEVPIIQDSVGNMEEIGRSSIAIGPDNTLYVGSTNSILYAISLTSFQAKTLYGTSGPIESSPLIGPDGCIYIGCNDNKVYKVLPGGGYGGHYQTGDSVISSPAMDAQGRIYVGSYDEYLYCIDSKNMQQVLWRYKTGGGIESSPAIDEEGNIYFGSNDGHIYSLDKEGNLRWKYPTSGAIGQVKSSPALGNGRVYIGSDDSHLYCLSTEGKLLWSFSTFGKVRVSSAIGPDGKIYVVSEQGYLYCLDQNGKEIWTRPLATVSYSSPAIASDGKVYIGTQEGKFYVIDSDGTKLWDCQLSGPIHSSPVIASDGMVYIASSKFVYKIKGYAGLASEIWPMFHHDPWHTGRIGGGP